MDGILGVGFQGLFVLYSCEDRWSLGMGEKERSYI